MIYLDEGFLNKYFIDDLPYQKGSDYIYMAVAHVENIPIITEDKQFFGKKKKPYFTAYKIKEYVNNLQRRLDEEKRS